MQGGIFEPPDLSFDTIIALTNLAQHNFRCPRVQDGLTWHIALHVRHHVDVMDEGRRVVCGRPICVRVDWSVGIRLSGCHLNLRKSMVVRNC